jgi:hypothetical protein
MDTQGEYLTKRVIIRATKKGMKTASQGTMNAMGYNMIAMDGWIVKKFKNGNIERIEKIKENTHTGPLSLD